MKKNSFLEGAFVATFSILLCKIIGLLYVIPFYGIIGNKGGALYSYAYSIYSIFLSLSTCGIPVAVSKLVSEYNALGEYSLKEKIYKMAANIIIIIGLVAFILLFVFAENIAYMFIGNIQGGNTIEDVTTAIRVISVALLIVPQQSILRGYLQGHKMITTTSISNLLEQVVRVAIIVAGSYISVKVLGLPINFAVYIAIFSATVAALSSYIYLKIKIHRNKSQFNTETIEETEESKKVTKKDLLKRIVFYALPFVIIDLIRSAYGMVDSFTVVKTMVNIGYDVTVAETTLGVVATWATKLNMIVASVALGLVTSLIPNIAGSFAKKDMKDVNKKLNQSYTSILFITIPMAVGLSFLAQPVWISFYGYDELSINIFRIYILQSIIFCVFTIALNTSQTMNKTKLSLGALIINFALKMALNGPMMYLLKYIGIESYYAPIITNVIVQGGATIFILMMLKREFKFSYRDIIKSFGKTVICLIAMLAVLFLMTLVLPLTTTTRLSSILIIIPYTLVGATIYMLVAKKINLISDIFGNNYIKDIKSKLAKKFKKNVV